MPFKDPEAQREYQRQWNARRRAAFVAGQSCVDCGSTDGLELDHLDPQQKVSHRIWTWRPARIAEEIAKCVWRCRACHQERHAAQLRSHGTGGYKRGCRCDICRAAKAAANRRYKQSRREAA